MQSPPTMVKTTLAQANQYNPRFGFAAAPTTRAPILPPRPQSHVKHSLSLFQTHATTRSSAASLSEPVRMPQPVPVMQPVPVSFFNGKPGVWVFHPLDQLPRLVPVNIQAPIATPSPAIHRNQPK